MLSPSFLVASGLALAGITQAQPLTERRSPSEPPAKYYLQTQLRGDSSKDDCGAPKGGLWLYCTLAPESRLTKRRLLSSISQLTIQVLDSVTQCLAPINLSPWKHTTTRPTRNSTSPMRATRLVDGLWLCSMARISVGQALPRL